MNIAMFLLIEIFLFIGAVIDIKSKKIPITYLVAITIYCFIVGKVNYHVELINILFNVIPGTVFILISLLFKDTIGLGDGFVILAIGLGYGLKNTILILMSSLLLATIYAVILLVTKKGKLKSTMAFLPFLFLSTIFPFISMVME